VRRWLVDVRHTLLCAVSTLVSTPFGSSRKNLCRHESRHVTQERVRHIAVILIVALLSSCSRPAEQPIRVAIGGQAQLIYLTATLAQELGYYKDEGLDVTLLDFPGGQKSLEALLGGSTDVVCGFYDHTIVMAAEGKELREFVAILRYPGLVAASPKVARIEDLKGKIVGVSAAGSSTNFFLNHLLVSHGMKPDDVSTASIGMSATAVAAVTRNKVDAAIMTDPALAIVSKQVRDLHILADTRTAEGVRAVFGVDSYPSAVLYSTARWVHEHGSETKKLAHAITRTLEWMRLHSPEDLRAKMPAQFRTDDQATDIEGLQSLKAMLSPDGRLSPESAEIVKKVLSVSLEKVRSANIDLAKTYTNDFLSR
jgi:NitT/TauT family transport system substrate-binding protein